MEFLHAFIINGREKRAGITADITKTTSADKNITKKKPISRKCSRSLCWRLVELASRISGVFSWAGRLFAVDLLALISKLRSVSVDIFV